MPLRTAVVLAGGAGLRLRPLTNDRPKVMIEVAGRPLLDWTLEWLKRNGVHKVVIGVAYRAESIMKHLGVGKSFGLEVAYSRHTVEGGTAEGFRLAIERHVADSDFFAINGDELTNVKLQQLAALHLQHKSPATITVSPLPSPFGVVELNGADVFAFREKPLLSSVFVSVGVYAFGEQIVSYLPRTGDIERTVFPRLAEERLLKAFKHDGFWMTVNTVKDLDEVEKVLLNRESEDLKSTRQSMHSRRRQINEV